MKDTLTVRVSPANNKLGRIPNVSIIPIKDCGNCDMCRTDCYALKAWRQYKNVRECWGNNSKAFRSNMSLAFSDLYDWFASKRKQPRFFRIHVAGDFLNQEHVNGYIGLAAAHPETKFLAFTKMHGLDYSECPDNLQIILSAWPGLEFDNPLNLPVAWVQDGTETRIPDNAIECPGLCDDCGMCWNLSKLDRDVFFYTH